MSRWTPVKEALQSRNCLDAASLNPGASAEDLAALERHVGLMLPDSVKDFLSEHDGQSDEAECAICLRQHLLSTSGIRACWDDWRAIDEPAMNDNCAKYMASEPTGAIKAMYTNRKWVPLTHDGSGNHIGLDFDPDHAGRAAQIIAFGRDEDTKRLKAESFDAYLLKLASELRDPAWTFSANGWKRRKEPVPGPAPKEAVAPSSKPWWKAW